MKYSLVVLGAPVSSQSSKTALRFALAALEEGHEIYRVFFFDDGVAVASELVVTPQDEVNTGTQWSDLADSHRADLVVCVSSALKRGILDATEASRYEKPCHNLRPGFNISGLGQLIDATLESDRVITFGA